MAASINNTPRFHTLPYLDDAAKLELYQIEERLTTAATQVKFRYTYRHAFTQQVIVHEFESSTYHKSSLSLYCVGGYVFQLQKSGQWESLHIGGPLGLTTPPLATQFIP